MSGLPWQTSGGVTDLAPANLWSKILCRRHNQALMELDGVAVRFFRELFGVVEFLRAHRGQSAFLINGADLELWFLKLLCGLCAVAHVGRNDPWLAPADWLALLLGTKSFDYAAGQGLYGSAWLGRSDRSGNYTELTVVYREVDMAIAGLQANMGGVWFLFALERWMKRDLAILHPSELVFSSDSSGKAKRVLALGWEEHPSGKAVHIRT